MPEEDDRPGPWRHASAGLEFIVTFGLLLGAGLVADRWLDSVPLWTLLGAAAGFAAGLYRLVRTAREIERGQSDKKEDDQGKAPRPPG